MQQAYFDNQRWNATYRHIVGGEQPSPLLTKKLNKAFRRPRQNIPALQETPTADLLTDTASKHQLVTNFATHQFRARNPEPDAMTHVLSRTHRRLTDEQRDAADGPLTPAELERACKALAPGKAAGPDGLPAEFFQAYWPILSPLMQRLCDQAAATGTAPAGLCDAVIVLLHKKDSKTLLANYRPISLLNVAYKIIAKAWASRTQLFLDLLIGPEQTGFIRGRNIKDNALLVELAAAATLEDNKKLLIVSCDFEKAFDSVSRPFLAALLRQMNLPESLIAWYSLLHTSTTAQYLVDGTLTQRVFLWSGVRQGCPWAPLLFNLVAQSLAGFLQLVGINTCVRGHLLSLSQYADDTDAFLEPHLLPLFKPQCRYSPMPLACSSTSPSRRSLSSAIKTRPAPTSPPWPTASARSAGTATSCPSSASNLETPPPPETPSPRGSTP